MKEHWLKVAVGVVVALMGWGGSVIYDNLKQTIHENRSSIQALIDLHLRQ